MKRLLSVALASPVLLGACAAGGARSDRAAPAVLPRPTAAVPYESFYGASRALYPWVGERVAVLTPSAEHDPVALSRLVDLLDAAVAFAREATGGDPEPWRLHEGRIPIAVEAETCGKGCGFLGATGVELVPEVFDTTVRELRTTGRLDLVVAYEIGRNFWLRGDALEYFGDDRTGTVSAGGARLLGLWTVDALGCGLAPHQGAGGATYRAAVEALVDLYERSDATWATTLRVGKAVENELGLGASNLFAAFLLRVQRESGRADFPRRFFRAVLELPPAADTGGAVDNLVVAASVAAGRDLTATFRDRWRFPVSAEARERALAALAGAR